MMKKKKRQNTVNHNQKEVKYCGVETIELPIYRPNLFYVGGGVSNRGLANQVSFQ
jgi:hypothetical protein